MNGGLEDGNTDYKAICKAIADAKADADKPTMIKVRYDRLHALPGWGASLVSMRVGSHILLATGNICTSLLLLCCP